MPDRSSYSTAELRRVNRNAVYHTLYSLDEPIAKQDLTYKLSMSLPTLTQNLKELMAEGLVTDADTAHSTVVHSTGGRKPKLFSIVPSARIAVGGELTDSQIRLTAIDLRANELAYQVIARPFHPDESYAQALADSLEAFLDENSLERSRLLGVGLTIPGIVSESQEMIEYAPTIGLREPVKNLFTQFIPYPTLVDNDATCGGFAEWWNRSDLSHMAYLSLGRGVGGSILVERKIDFGSHSRAGEFGHMLIHSNGRICNCGKRGCLEAYCSSTCLSTSIGITLDEFFAGLETGIPEYRDIFEHYLDDLAIGINNIRVSLDCEIVIGGAVSQYLIAYQEALEKRLRALSLFHDGSPYVHICRFHEKSNSIGAALYHVHDFVDKI